MSARVTTYPTATCDQAGHCDHGQRASAGEGVRRVADVDFEGEAHRENLTATGIGNSSRHQRFGRRLRTAPRSVEPARARAVYRLKIATALRLSWGRR